MALALAVATHGAHEWIYSKVRHPNVAAALTVIGVLVIVAAPAILAIDQVAGEAMAALDRLNQELTSGRWRSAFDRFPRVAAWMRWFHESLDPSSALESATAAIGVGVKNFVKESAVGFVQLLIAFFVLFYFFRDRRQILDYLRRLSPLPAQQTEDMFHRIADVLYATVYGTLTVALIQGVLGGLMFWWLELPAPVLWGAVMALLSIIPVFGAFMIWVPAAIYLALEGDWTKALILTAWGSIVIGLIDNLLYPLLVGERSRMHTVAIFIAIMGGLVAFGAAGLIVGPVVLAITLALLQVWRQHTDQRT